PSPHFPDGSALERTRSGDLRLHTASRILAPTFHPIGFRAAGRYQCGFQRLLKNRRLRKALHCPFRTGAVTTSSREYLNPVAWQSSQRFTLSLTKLRAE